MNRPGALALAGVAAVLTVSAVYLLVQHNDSSQTAVGKAATLPAPLATAAATEVAPMAEKQSSGAERAVEVAPSPQARQKLETLLRRLNESRSTRQFVAEALKDAQRGGVIYALAASVPCDTFRASRESAKPPMKSNQAQHAAALLEARCDITGDEAFAQLSTAMQTNAVELGSDPIFAMLVPGLNGKSRDDSLRHARALLASGDPIAMQSLVHLDFRDSLAETPYFDGRHYRSAADRDLMDDAWQLVECSLGVACGPDATQTLLLCATRDWCGQSVAEAMEIGHAASGTWGQVRTLADSLLSAIRAKRAAAFVPES